MAFGIGLFLLNNSLTLINRFSELRSNALERLKIELSPKFKYHSFDHTFNMLSVVEKYTEHYELSSHQIELLKIAILYHDMGFIEDWRDHERRGAEMVEVAMQELKYSTEDILMVKQLIMATKVPQEPETNLERIICDIDLDYLGRDDYFVRSELLFEEWMTIGLVANRAEWEKKELDFLTNHQFHSVFGKKYRQPKLNEHLIKIKSR